METHCSSQKGKLQDGQVIDMGKAQSQHDIRCRAERSRGSASRLTWRSADGSRSRPAAMWVGDWIRENPPIGIRGGADPPPHMTAELGYGWTPTTRFEAPLVHPSGAFCFAQFIQRQPGTRAVPGWAPIHSSRSMAPSLCTQRFHERGIWPSFMSDDSCASSRLRKVISPRARPAIWSFALVSA